MSLLLTILTGPSSISITESSRTFDVQGGTIGRGKDNTWVLEDPERFLSSLHCQISNENGQFFLTDLSTNGTFLNGASEPMGKGNKFPLNDGDKFVLGDYEFSVSLWSPVQTAPPSQLEEAGRDPFSSGGMPAEFPFAGGDPFASNTDISDDFSGDSGFGSSPFDSGFVSQDDSFFVSSQEETDPLAALDKAQGNQSAGIPSSPDPFSSGNNTDPFSGPKSADPFGSINSSNLFSGSSNSDPFADLDSSDPFGGSNNQEQFAGTNNSAALSGANGADSFARSGNTDSFNEATFSDQADALNQQVTWPESVQESGAPGVIPDDWDDDLLSSEPAEPDVSMEQVSSVQAHTPPPVSIPEPAIIPMPGQQKQAEPMTSDVIQRAVPAESTATVSDVINTDTSVSREQQLAIERSNAKIEAELEILKQQIRSQQQVGGASQITVDTSLVEAMGIKVQNLTDEKITEINVRAGEVIRESVKGLMQVLSSRSSIKNEFRMNVTTIQPVENNPLKFSVNVDDALENMFVKQGNAYKKPVEAVREGFDGVAEHQIAIIAGIRAAFRGVVERFDPITLEQRFSKQKKGGLIPGSQKARNWDLYGEYFSELVGDMDNSFQYLFGDEFVQAYEDQLRKLAMARKSKSNAEDQ